MQLKDRFSCSIANYHLIMKYKFVQFIYCHFY